MKSFALHPEADIDLIEILDYLAADSPQAADSFLARYALSLPANM